LVVDDEPQIRSFVKSVLVRERHRVLEASDGVDAVALLEKQGQKVDLLLTDIVMPRMDGIELAGRVSSRFPAVRVLYMSGQCEVSAVHRDIENKGFGFIRKPFDVGTLSVKVGEFLAKPARKDAASERTDQPARAHAERRSA
jgi:two-component system cell cycle sensor histidine kinase/response regulator CckA